MRQIASIEIIAFFQKIIITAISNDVLCNHILPP